MPERAEDVNGTANAHAHNPVSTSLSHCTARITTYEPATKATRSLLSCYRNISDSVIPSLIFPATSAYATFSTMAIHWSGGRLITFLDKSDSSVPALVSQLINVSIANTFCFQDIHPGIFQGNISSSIGGVPKLPSRYRDDG